MKPPEMLALLCPPEHASFILGGCWKPARRLPSCWILSPQPMQQEGGRRERAKLVYLGRGTVWFLMAAGTNGHRLHTKTAVAKNNPRVESEVQKDSQEAKGEVWGGLFF